MAGHATSEEHVKPWRRQLNLREAWDSVNPVLGQRQDVPVQCKFMTFPMGYQEK